MKTIWKTIKKWLKVHAPDIYQDLLPGVNRRAILEAEDEMGLQFPKDLKESLTICNGQLGAAGPMLGDWQLISLEVILNTWQMMKELFDTSKEEKPTEETDSEWWNIHWIPVAYDGLGDYLCIDLSDKSGRHKGRVITFWHTDAKRNVVADSFKALLKTFADDLASNKYKYEDEALKRIE